MAQNSKIEWTTHTANLWHGCTDVTEGCDHCYAETLSRRWGNDVWGNDKPRKLIKSVWNDFAKYQKMAAAAGEMHRVFVGSMMDIFEKPMPLINSKMEPLELLTTDDLRQIFFRDVVPNSPNLIFLLLTKRPSNINKYIPLAWKIDPPDNVMFGTSISTQDNAKHLIPQLLKVNGKKFLSIEPQIESVDITNGALHNAYSYPTDTYVKPSGEVVGIEWTDPGDKFIGIDWVIQGGESGHQKRPFNLDWAYKMKQQCKEARVPYFFKQIDKIQTIPDDLMIREFPILRA